MADTRGMEQITKRHTPPPGIDPASCPPSRCEDCGEPIYGLLRRCEFHEAEWLREQDLALAEWRAQQAELFAESMAAEYYEGLDREAQA